MRDRIELDFLKDDIPLLIKESKDGIARVGQIVKDLKNFSRVDSNQEWQWSNLQQGIDSTLNIVANEIKYKADVIKDYAELPEVECLPSQINQVIMNLVVNAAQAMGPASPPNRSARARAWDCRCPTASCKNMPGRSRSTAR